MIKISRLADYAVVILTTLVQSDESLMAAIDLAEEAHLPEPTVAKILKLLAKGGVVKSVRGAGGGYKLAGSPNEISIAQVIAAVDGPIALTACVEGHEVSCDYACSCPVKGRWDDVNDAVKGALEGVTLTDMATNCIPRVSGGLEDSRFRGKSAMGLV